MNEIIINNDVNIKNVLLLDNGVLVEKYKYSGFKKNIEGNIYIGILKDILVGMEAAFIDIGEKKNSFIHLREILGNEYKKEELKKLRCGMPILVQVKKDATSCKGARVVTNIQITGKFGVFMPKENFITISQKIEDEQEKERLINIVKKYIPNETGFIIRTAAEGKSEEEIKQDIIKLLSIWNKIEKKAGKKSNKPCLIYENYDIIQRMIIDMCEKDINRIIVNTEEDYNEIKKILIEVKNDYSILELKKENLLNMYNLKKEIDESCKRKIWLKCGGFITIDKTEALTAIDVNSGKYVGKSNLEKTVFKVNKEASIEIAKQLRLRDIGGIIIIDFIDMHDEQNKVEIIKTLSDKLKNDRAKTQIVGFSKLNLLEMTRKHLHSEQIIDNE